MIESGNPPSLKCLNETLKAIEEQASTMPTLWADPILEAVKTRKKWAHILHRFPTYKDQYGYEAACRKLGKEFNYSASNIDKIVSKMNPHRKVGKN